MLLYVVYSEYGMRRSPATHNIVLDCRKKHHGVQVLLAALASVVPAYARFCVSSSPSNVQQGDHDH